MRMACSHSSFVLFLFFFSFPLIAQQEINAAAAPTRPPLLGGWQQIADVSKNTHVQEIGKFAVAEFDRQQHGHLKFITVVEGRQQVVAGTNYMLLIEASNAKLVKIYKGVVWEKAWLKFRNLTSFEPVLP